MRTLTLILAAAALVGCRSSERDYYSVNRSDREFMRESMRDARKLRREEWREATNFSARYRENRKLARSDRDFAVETFFLGEWQNFRDMIAGVKREVREDRKDIWKSARFGFLDSGE